MSISFMPWLREMLLLKQWDFYGKSSATVAWKNDDNWSWCRRFIASQVQFSNVHLELLNSSDYVLKTSFLTLQAMFCFLFQSETLQNQSFCSMRITFASMSKWWWSKTLLKEAFEELEEVSSLSWSRDVTCVTWRSRDKLLLPKTHCQYLAYIAVKIGRMRAYIAYRMWPAKMKTSPDWHAIRAGDILTAELEHNIKTKHPICDDESSSMRSLISNSEIGNQENTPRSFKD